MPSSFGLVFSVHLSPDFVLKPHFESCATSFDCPPIVLFLTHIILIELLVFSLALAGCVRYLILTTTFAHPGAPRSPFCSYRRVLRTGPSALFFVAWQTSFRQLASWRSFPNESPNFLFVTLRFCITILSISGRVYLSPVLAPSSSPSRPSAPNQPHFHGAPFSPTCFPLVFKTLSLLRSQPNGYSRCCVPAKEIRLPAVSDLPIAPFFDPSNRFLHVAFSTLSIG